MSEQPVKIPVTAPNKPKKEGDGTFFLKILLAAMAVPYLCLLSKTINSILAKGKFELAFKMLIGFGWQFAVILTVISVIIGIKLFKK